MYIHLLQGAPKQMKPLAEHPTDKWIRERPAAIRDASPSSVLDAQSLRKLCLEAGADDVGFVEADRPELADQHAEIVGLFPTTKTLIGFVLRMNRENIRTPARSIANV